MERNLNLEKLEIGNIYKYKELCDIINDNTNNGGKQRILQYNDWSRFFRWSKPTSQKYLIEEIYDVPKDKIDKRTNNGGIREGAGAKPKLEEEFECLFNFFLATEKNKNIYYRNNPRWNTIYFNKDNFSKVFGIYRDLYAAQSNKEICLKSYYDISDRIRRKTESLFFSKIKKRTDVDFNFGIIAINSKTKEIEYRDDFLNEWEEHKESYIKEKGYENDFDIVRNGKWFDMLIYISSFFNGYDTVKRFLKLSYDPDNIKKYDIDTINKYRHTVNEIFINDICNSILKKELKLTETHNDLIDLYELLEEPIPYGQKRIIFNEDKFMYPYRYIIDNYVRI